MVVVTGATGHIGNVLVRRLLKEGYKVRVLLHHSPSAPSLSGLEVEVVYGDILNKESLVKAFTGAEKVFHLAGLVTILPDNKKTVFDVNIQGTENVVEACQEAHVKKLIYTSSIHALEDIPRGPVVTEDIPVSPDNAIGNYGLSKAGATLKIMKAVDDKTLEAVMVHPTGVVGDHDYHSSLMGRTMTAYVTGKLLVGIGGYDFVDVDDVVNGIYLADKKGKNGEHYILSGTAISTKDLKLKIDKLMGRHPFAFELPGWILNITLPTVTVLYYITKILRIHWIPLLTPDSGHILFSNYNISCEKAKKELGYTITPLDETLEKIIKWNKEYISVNK